jgi:iron-regulated transporter 1
VSIYPWAKERLGLWNSGGYALVWQTTFVGIAATSFWFLNSSVTFSLALLTSCVLISRVGLWLFDMCARQIAQETIKENVRGVVNGVWQSVTNTFELSVYLLTMYFSRPQDFGKLSLVSFIMVFSSMTIFLSSRPLGHSEHSSDSNEKTVSVSFNDKHQRSKFDKLNAESETDPVAIVSINYGDK